MMLFKIVFKKTSLRKLITGTTKLEELELVFGRMGIEKELKWSLSLIDNNKHFFLYSSFRVIFPPFCPYALTKIECNRSTSSRGNLASSTFSNNLVLKYTAASFSSKSAA